MEYQGRVSGDMTAFSGFIIRHHTYI